MVLMHYSCQALETLWDARDRTPITHFQGQTPPLCILPSPLSKPDFLQNTSPGSPGRFSGKQNWRKGQIPFSGLLSLPPIHMSPPHTGPHWHQFGQFFSAISKNFGMRLFKLMSSIMCFPFEPHVHFGVSGIEPRTPTCKTSILEAAVLL